MKENEFRIRSVERFVVTHYRGKTKQTASCRTIGEYDNIACAEEVAAALSSLAAGSKVSSIVGRSPLQKFYDYAIVERTHGEVGAMVWYAQWYGEVKQHLRQLETHTGKEFKIFATEVTDQVELANRRAQSKLFDSPDYQFRPLDLAEVPRG